MAFTVETTSASNFELRRGFGYRVVGGIDLRGARWVSCEKRRLWTMSLSGTEV